MLIAQHKKKTNIAEYILYMWQVEDIIRSNNFDLSQINSLIIEKFDTTQDLRAEMKLWYQNLIENMMKEGIFDKGHLKSTMKYVNELNNLHNSLLTTIQDQKYQTTYMNAKDNINGFIIRSGGESQNEIHACLNGLYGFLLLKLKREKVSDATKAAMESFSQLLAILADRYNQLRRGELKLPKEKNN